MEKHFCPYCMNPTDENGNCPVCGLTAGNYVPSPHHLPPGTVLIGRYLTGRVLGEGGFGITYIGRDLRLDLKVAIKEYYPVDRATRNAAVSLNVTSFIGPQERSFERGKQKFLKEARTMARMEKQQVIVSVRDFFEANNTVYIVMEYVEGTTFAELTKQRGGRIPEEELFRVIEPLFGALSDLHEVGLIHRDISPDNLMLEDGRVRLLDFGCARESADGNKTLTISLKHGYAPLEQYQESGQGPWTDVYALCATIYFCLTGQTPPRALDRIAEDNILLPSKLGVAISPSREKALLKGLNIRPNQRYQSMKELWAALYKTKDDVLIPDPVSPDPKPITSMQNLKTGTEEVPCTGMTTDSGTDDEESADAVPQITSGEDIDSTGTERESGEKPDPIHVRKNHLPVFIGAAAAAVLLIGMAVFAGRGKTSTPNSNPEADSVSGTAVTESAAESGETADSRLFEGDGVATLTDEFTYEELSALMEDDSVSAIVIDSTADRDYESRVNPDDDADDIDVFLVTKPLRLTETTAVELGNFSAVQVTGDGYLDIRGDAWLGHELILEGSGEKASFSPDYDIWIGNTILFRDENAQIVYGSGNSEPVLDVELPDFSGAVTVSSREELEKAETDGTPVIISPDFEDVSEEEIELATDAIVEEGTEFSVGRLNLTAGCTLVNRGTINGMLDLQGHLINRGTIQLANEDNDDNCLFAWGEDVLLVNGYDGRLSLSGGTNDLRGESVLCNDGNIDVTARGKLAFDDASRMLNFGSVDILDNAILELRGWEMSENYGMLHANAGCSLMNYGYLCNAGALDIEDNGTFYNTVLENRGSFRMADGSDAILEGVRFSYQDSSYEGLAFPDVRDPWYMEENLTVKGISGTGTMRIKNGEDIAETMNDPETEYVILYGDALISSDLAVTKPLTVYGTLTVSDGAVLSAQDQVQITVAGGGTLRGSVHLSGEAVMMLEDGARFESGNGGTLVIDDNGLLLAQRGSSVDLEGGNLQMSSAAALIAGADGEDRTFSGANIEMDAGSVLVSELGRNATVEYSESTFAVDASTLLIGNDTARLTDCYVTVSNQGVLRTTTDMLLLYGTSVDIENSAYMEAYEAGIEMQDNALLTNNGAVEYLTRYGRSFMMEDSGIVNHGTMQIVCNGEMNFTSDDIENDGTLMFDNDQ